MYSANFIQIFLAVSAVMFIFVRYLTGNEVRLYVIYLFIAGFAIGGPFNLIPGAVTANLVIF